MIYDDRRHHALPHAAFYIAFLPNFINIGGTYMPEDIELPIKSIEKTLGLFLISACPSANFSQMYSRRRFLIYFHTTPLLYFEFAAFPFNH